MKKASFILSTIWPLAAFAGDFPDVAGAPGSTAISHTDLRFVAWANGYLPPQYGTGVDDIWKTPLLGLGPATMDPMHIVGLGNGGRMTLFFPHPIRDGQGADFAVFENSFNHTFLELAFVEVSSDGVNFYRFPAISDTVEPAGGFGGIDATDIHNLAGKYRGGFGTPFDLDEIVDAPLLDKENVRFVRIVDIVGDGNTNDSRGTAIYDPWPVEGSGGFDLDAIGVIHQNDGPFRVTRAAAAGSTFTLEWESNPGSSYRIETSTTLDPVESWLPVDQVAGSTLSGGTVFPAPADPAEPRRFWRVVRLD